MKMQFPTIVLALMTTLLIASDSAQADDPAADFVCEVLTHPREYVGQTFTFKGTFYHGLHTTFFTPEQKCRDDVGIQAVGYLPPMPPPFTGRGTALLIAKGRIVIHRQTPERMIGKPAEAVAFSVTHVAKVPAKPKLADQRR